ncbi:hypothetical protein HDV06_002361 [Boothiomyces sp. JEL0866]|nr:hypothetical protein HDV06_002361 [Boothiomyces sp. JEL0866]
MDLSKLTFVDFSNNKLKSITVEFGEFLTTLAAFEIEKNPWGALELQQLNTGISFDESKGIINNYLQTLKEKADVSSSPVKEPKKKNSILGSPALGFLKKRPPSAKGGDHRDISSAVSEAKDDNENEVPKAKKEVKHSNSASPTKVKDNENQIQEAPVLPQRPPALASKSDSVKHNSSADHHTPTKANIEEISPPSKSVEDVPIPERSGAQLKKIGRAAGPKGRRPPTVEFVVKNAEEAESTLQTQVEVSSQSKKEIEEKPIQKDFRGSSDMLNEDPNAGSSTVSKKKGIFGFGGDKNKAGHQLADLFKHNPKANTEDQEKPDSKRVEAGSNDSEPPAIPSKATKPYRPPSTGERNNPSNFMSPKPAKKPQTNDNIDSSLKNSKNGSVEEKLDNFAKEEPKKEIVLPKKNPLLTEMAEHSLKSTKPVEKDQSKEEPKKEILLPKKNPIAAEIAELPPKPLRNKPIEPEPQKEEQKKEITVPKKLVPSVSNDIAEIPLRPTKPKDSLPQPKEEETKKEMLLPKKNVITPAQTPNEVPPKPQRSKTADGDAAPQKDPAVQKEEAPAKKPANLAEIEAPPKAHRNKVSEDQSSPAQPAFPTKVVLGGGSMRLPKPAPTHGIPVFAPIDDSKLETSTDTKPAAPQINLAELKSKQSALESSKNQPNENSEIEPIDVSPIKRRPVKPPSEARDTSKAQSMYETSNALKRDVEPASNSLYDDSKVNKTPGQKPAFDLSEIKLKQNNLKKTESDKEFEAPTLPAKQAKPLPPKPNSNESPAEVPPRPAKPAFEKPAEPALPPKPKIVQQQDSAPIPPWKAELEKRKQNNNQVQ